MVDRAVNITAAELHGDQMILITPGRGGINGRSVIDRVDRNVQRAGGMGVGGVADLRNGAVPVCRRGETVIAIGGDRYSTHAGDRRDLTRGKGASDALYGECRDTQSVIDIDVIAKHVAGCNMVFIDSLGIGEKDARVVDRGDVDGQGRGDIAAGTVGDGVAHGRYAAVVVGSWGEGVSAVGADDQGADVGDGRGLACSERAMYTIDGEVEHADRTVDTARTGQHAAADGGVFSRSHVFAEISEAVINRGDADVQG